VRPNSEDSFAGKVEFGAEQMLNMAALCGLKLLCEVLLYQKRPCLSQGSCREEQIKLVMGFHVDCGRDSRRDGNDCTISDICCS